MTVHHEDVRHESAETFSFSINQLVNQSIVGHRDRQDVEVLYNVLFFFLRVLAENTPLQGQNNCSLDLSVLYRIPRRRSCIFRALPMNRSGGEKVR